MLQEIFGCPGLKKLRIDEYYDDTFVRCVYFKDLESLTVKSITFTMNEMSAMMKIHNRTLRYLCLGAESEVLLDYHESANTLNRRQRCIDELVDEPDHDDHEDHDIDNAEDDRPWLKLEELHIVGFDVHKIIKPSHGILKLQTLTSMTLESCPGLEDAFDLLATDKDKSDLSLRSTLRLRSFSLRHEASNQQFRNRLLDFLGAICGLTHLSVLLEDVSRSHANHLDPMLAVHGQSLRSLVWDERSGRRDSFTTSEPLSAASYQLIGRITAHCPYLIELGVSMDWRDFTQKDSFIPNDYNRNLTSTAFARLKALRTLNIRTMPFVNAKKMALPLSEIQASFANSLLTIISCKNGREDVLSRSPPRNLETLALGALTYRDIRNGLGCHGVKDGELYQFLRLKVYRVIHNHQVDGKSPKPLAILAETGTYEKTEANGGAVNVLKPYWLG
ncbi:MAG: hypothetical protein Q9204_003369 [Flavoplaca sp. TL-2023a]